MISDPVNFTVVRLIQIALLLYNAIIYRHVEMKKAVLAIFACMQLLCLAPRAQRTISVTRFNGRKLSHVIIFCAYPRMLKRWDAVIQKANIKNSNNIHSW